MRHNFVLLTAATVGVPAASAQPAGQKVAWPVAFYWLSAVHPAGLRNVQHWRRICGLWRWASITQPDDGHDERWKRRLAQLDPAAGFDAAANWGGATPNICRQRA